MDFPVGDVSEDGSSPFRVGSPSLLCGVIHDDEGLVIFGVLRTSDWQSFG